MTKPPLISEYGLTIKELKEYISDLPDTNEYGEDNYVWVGDAGGLDNVAYSIWCDGGSEISIHFKGYFHGNMHAPPLESDNWTHETVEHNGEKTFPLLDWKLLEKIENGLDARYIPALVQQYRIMRDIIVDSGDELKTRLLKADEFNRANQHTLYLVHEILRSLHPEFLTEDFDIDYDKALEAANIAYKAPGYKKAVEDALKSRKSSVDNGS